MPLVWPSIVRLSVVGSLDNQLCVNVFDVAMQDDLGIGGRPEQCFALAGDFLNNWSDHVLPLVIDDYEAQEVRWVDLHSASGSTGARSSTSDNTWPALGGQAVPGLPNNSYAYVAKNMEGSARNQRRGVTRLGGLPEGYTLGGTQNNLSSGSVALLNAAFESLKDGINGAGAPGQNQRMGVLHTVDGEATGFSNISQFSVRSRLGTLRRRMPGYGQ